MEISVDQNYVALSRLINNPSLSTNDVQTIINRGLNVNYIVPANSLITRWIGYALLHIIIEKESVLNKNEIVKVLCSNKANYLQKNNQGFTPLRLAYELYKDSKDAKKLINELLAIQLESENAANPCCNKGISHFHIACLTGNSKVVSFFLNNDVLDNQAINMDSRIFPGCSSLHLSMYSGLKNIVQMLLKQKSKPQASRTLLNARGMTPLHLIVEKQLEDVSIIGTVKSNETKIRKNEIILAEMSKSTAADPNPVDYTGLSYLHVYCTRKCSFKLEIWNKLLAAGVDLNAAVRVDSPVWAGYTPAHFAALCNLDTMILLLENGANPFAKDVNGLTPIDLYLARYESTDLGRIFDACNALKSIQFQNNSKLSDALAAFQTDENLESYLESIDVGTAVIPLDSPLWPGWTLLHVALKLIHRDDESKIKACLEAGVSFTDQDSGGMTALHVAYYKDKKNCIKEILRAHFSVSDNPVDENGLSHFEISCIANSYDVVEMFLSKGTNPNIKLQKDTRWGSKIVIKAGSTPLHIAAITSAPVMAKLFLANGADPFALDDDGLTWIHRLFESQDYYTNFTLLSLPELLCSNPVAPGGLSHLHVVSSANNKKAVEALLPLATNINEPIGIESSRYFGKFKRASCLDTALHLAAKNCSIQAVEVIDLLLKNGADVTAKNADGLNPLHVALLKYELHNFPVLITIRRLVSEYDEKNLWPDDTGLTKLHVACFLQDIPLIEKLLESGERANSQMKVDSPFWPGETPLHLLIKRKYPKEDGVVRLLLRQIIQELTDTDNKPLYKSRKRRKKSQPVSRKLVVNSEGLSALHISCMGSDEGIVQNFIELGVDFNLPKDFFASEDAGFYPLHFAVKYGSNEVTELLLKSKINVDCQDALGNTPIHLAALNYNSKLEAFVRTNEYNEGTKRNYYDKTVVDLLIEKYRLGKKKNTVESAKILLISSFAHTFFKQVFETLIKSIPDVCVVDADGRNVIHHITYLWSTDSNFDEFVNNIKLLVQLGCELDLQDKDGQTPLHRAMSISEYKFKALLLIGADVNVVDYFQRTPLQCCYDNSNYYSDNRIMVKAYASKLEAAGLYINELNKKYAVHRDEYTDVVSKMNECIITESFTLRDVLRQKFVTKFRMMSYAQRQAILNYLKSDEVKKNYLDWIPLFNSQCHKACTEKKLFEATIEPLGSLLDPRLPNPCLESVLINLSNKDWKNIISAASEADT